MLRITELLEKKAKDENRERITQQELADSIGIPQSTMSRWVGNKLDRYDRHILVKLCEYFQCEVGDVLYIVWDKD